MIFTRFDPVTFWKPTEAPEQPEDNQALWHDPIDLLSLRQAREEVRSLLRDNIKLKEDREMLIGALERISAAETLPGRAREIAVAYLRKFEEE